ncbi:MAG TPA: aldolase/citrate lyase family protein [Thermoleophilaceae bacterium]|jgi:4-hydroxy-2-oxoheptanedioate aldolase
MLELVNQRRGLFVKLSTTEVIDVVAASGFDFAVVDLEHSQLSEGDARALVRHARAIGFPALVRLPEVDRGAVNRLLEAGAAGIQLSTVRRVAQVRELCDATRYAPHGTRSISLAHAEAGFGAVPLADYVRAAAESPPLVVAQIETAETLDPLDEVLAAGADVAFLGLADLTVDLGLDDARVRARVEEVAAAAERAGVALGAFGLDDPRVVYRLVSSDLALMRAAVADAA